MLLLPPSADASEAAPAGDTGHKVRLCTERQRQTIRALLGRVGQTEHWLLAKLDLQRLDEVPHVVGTAYQLPRFLRPPKGGHSPGLRAPTPRDLRVPGGGGSLHGP
jgi:hypothetical protein